MASLDEELRLDEEENRRELAFIRSRLPATMKRHYSDNDIFFLMDAIVEYYFESGILESEDPEVDIDLMAVANYASERGREIGEDHFDPDDVAYIVEADLDFQEQNL